MVRVVLRRVRQVDKVRGARSAVERLQRAVVRLVAEVRILGARLGELQQAGAIAGPDPVAGLMMSTMSFFFYFNIRKIFGVDEFFSQNDEQAIATMARILEQGMKPR